MPAKKLRPKKIRRCSGGACSAFPVRAPGSACSPPSRSRRERFIVEYTGPLLTNQQCDEMPGQPLPVRGERALDHRRQDALERRALHQSFLPAECRSGDPRPAHPDQGDQEHRAGDEITYDYGKDHFNAYIKPHGCQCDKCREKRRKERAEVRAANARKEARGACERAARLTGSVSRAQSALDCVNSAAHAAISAMSFFRIASPNVSKSFAAITNAPGPPITFCLVIAVEIGLEREDRQAVDPDARPHRLVARLIDRAPAIVRAVAGDVDHAPRRAIGIVEQQRHRRIDRARDRGAAAEQRARRRAISSANAFAEAASEILVHGTAATCSAGPVHCIMMTAIARAGPDWIAPITRGWRNAAT